MSRGQYTRGLRASVLPKDELHGFGDASHASSVAVLVQDVGHAETPSTQTLRYIVDELADDLRRLGEIMGTDGPVWNLEDALTAASSAAPGAPESSEG